MSLIEWLETPRYVDLLFVTGWLNIVDLLIIPLAIICILLCNKKANVLNAVFFLSHIGYTFFIVNLKEYGQPYDFLILAVNSFFFSLYHIKIHSPKAVILVFIILMLYSYGMAYEWATDYGFFDLYYTKFMQLCYFMILFFTNVGAGNGLYKHSDNIKPRSDNPLRRN